MKDLKKFIFGEARFVFNGTEDPEKQMSVPSEQMSFEVEEPPQEPPRPLEEQVEVKKDAATSRVEARTIVELDKLHKELGSDLSDFLTAVNLQGKSVSGIQILKDLNFKKEDLAVKFFEFLRDRDLDKFAEKVGASVEDVERVVAEIYAQHAVKKLDLAIDKDFAKANPEVKMHYQVLINNVGEMEVIIGPPGVAMAHQKFVNEKKEKEEREKKDKSPEGEARLTRAEQLVKLKSTPVAKLLGFMGYKDENFEKILDGTDFVGAFLLGMLGYTEFVGDFYAGMVEMLPDKFRIKVNSWEESWKNSKFSAEKWRQGIDKGDVVVEKPMEPAQIKTDEFVNILKNTPEAADKLKKGVELTGDFEIKPNEGKESLKVVLKDGGKMVVPKDLEININGEGAKSDKEKTYTAENNEIFLKGKIPAGVIFQGKLKFEMV